jgi:hypothetical protein
MPLASTARNSLCLVCAQHLPVKRILLCAGFGARPPQSRFRVTPVSPRLRILSRHPAHMGEPRRSSPRGGAGYPPLDGEVSGATAPDGGGGPAYRYRYPLSQANNPQCGKPNDLDPGHIYPPPAEAFRFLRSSKPADDLRSALRDLAEFLWKLTI